MSQSKNREHISISLEELTKKIAFETFKQKLERLEKTNPRIKKLPRIEEISGVEDGTDCELPF